MKSGANERNGQRKTPATTTTTEATEIQVLPKQSVCSTNNLGPNANIATSARPSIADAVVKLYEGRPFRGQVKIVHFERRSRRRHEECIFDMWAWESSDKCYCGCCYDSRLSMDDYNGEKISKMKSWSECSSRDAAAAAVARFVSSFTDDDDDDDDDDGGLTFDKLSSSCSRTATAATNFSYSLPNSFTFYNDTATKTSSTSAPSDPSASPVPVSNQISPVPILTWKNKTSGGSEDDDVLLSPTTSPTTTTTHWQQQEHCHYYTWTDGRTPSQ